MAYSKVIVRREQHTIADGALGNRVGMGKAQRGAAQSNRGELHVFKEEGFD